MIKSLMQLEAEISNKLLEKEPKGLKFLAFADGVVLVQKENKLFIAILDEDYNIIRMYSSLNEKVTQCYTDYVRDCVVGNETTMDLTILGIGENND